LGGSLAFAQSWSTTGNAGTAPPTNFVGTIDNSPFEIHVDDAGGFGGVMRFEPFACSNNNPNGTNCGLNVIGGKLGLDGNSVGNGAVGATVLGGAENFDFGLLPNAVNNDFGTVSGGGANTANGGFDTIAGGQGNTTNGGPPDSATGTGGATVGGGQGNAALATNATVPGGFLNTASGATSFAAGNLADAKDEGSFVWSDRSASTFSSIGPNTFNVRAAGGVLIASAVNGSGQPAVGVALKHGSGSWQSLSDRNSKANFEAVNERELLRQLSAIPVQTWNYKAQDPSIRHIGPTAQDFKAAFKVGEDDTHITAIDSEGVALAAIQGLYTMVREKDQQLHALQSRMDDLEHDLTVIRTATTARNGAEQRCQSPLVSAEATNRGPL
jgi:hypothetical protein